jgi:hypothetical protein
MTKAELLALADAVDPNVHDKWMDGALTKAAAYLRSCAEQEPVVWMLKHEDGHWNTMHVDRLETQPDYVQRMWASAEPLFAAPVLAQVATQQPVATKELDDAIYALEWHYSASHVNDMTDEPRKRDARAIRGLKRLRAAAPVPAQPVKVTRHRGLVKLQQRRMAGLLTHMASRSPLTARFATQRKTKKLAAQREASTSTAMHTTLT